MTYYQGGPAYPPPPPPAPAARGQRRWLIILVAAIAAVVVAAGVVLITLDDNGSDDGAEAAFREFVDLRVTGQHGRLYETMHPAQQAIIGRDDFMTCSAREMDESGLVGDVDIDVTDRYAETVTIPGTNERAETTALVVTWSAMGSEMSDTAHLIEVDGNWRWTAETPENYQPGCAG